MTNPEAMTLVELAEYHPDQRIREIAQALLDILKDKTPIRTSDLSLRARDTAAPH